MLRLFAFLSLLTLTPIAYSVTSKAQGCTLQLLFYRDPATTDFALGDIQRELPDEFRLPLTRWLLARHIVLYRQGRLRARTFNLRWIFKDASATQQLLSALDQDMNYKHEDTVYTLEQVVDAFQNAFANAGGVLSKRWTDRRVIQKESIDDKRRFFRETLLELSYDRQTRPKQELVVKYFPSEAAFDLTSNGLWRKRQKVQLTSNYERMREYDRARRDLIGKGLASRSSTSRRAAISADQRRREQNTILTQAEAAFNEILDETADLPLSHILVSLTTPGSEDDTLLCKTFENILNAFGSFETFVMTLDERLGGKIFRGFDSETWAQELFLQLTQFYFEDSREGFQGFQTENPEDSHYLNPRNPLFLATGWRLEEATAKVRKRL